MNVYELMLAIESAGHYIDTDPAMVQDRETGKIFSVKAVRHEDSEGGGTLFIEVEEM